MTSAKTVRAREARARLLQVGSWQADVCDSLDDEVSVRSVVAAIVAPLDTQSIAAGRLIEASLERGGTETVISQSVHSSTAEPVITVPSSPLGPLPSALGRIKEAHAMLAAVGLRGGYFPVWKLQRRVSSLLYLSPFVGSPDHIVVAGCSSLMRLESKQIADIEIALLNGAAAYAQRLFEVHRICAVGTGVSYETLSGFNSRIRYITALQKVPLQPATPLVLKIEQIPVGTPAARVGELAAMLARPNVRVTLEFQSLRALPIFEFRLSASGLGGQVPKDVDSELAAKIIRSLVSAASAQKAFVFLDRLDTPDLTNQALQNHVRFGTGMALGTRHLSGLESIPDFPLSLAGSR